MWSLLLLLPFLLRISSCTSDDASFEILALSDIHLDTHYNAQSSQSAFCRGAVNKTEKIAPYGRYGCDPPLSLFKAVLNRAHKQFQGSSPKYITITGDFVGHGIAEDYGLQEALDIFTAIKELIAQKFPNSVILPALGNNDFLLDYQVPSGTAFISQFYDFYYNTWFGSNAPSMNQNVISSKRVRAMMRRTGLYTAQIAPHLFVLSFNSVFYSPRNDVTNDSEGAQLQLQWMEEILQDSGPDDQFILLYHIAPGRNILSAQEWRESDELAFLALLQKYKAKIKMNFAGHLHLETLHSFVNCSIWEPFGSALLGPSISTIFSNNPAFRVYKFSQESILESYVDHFLLLNNYNDDLWAGRARSISSYWNVNYGVDLLYGQEYSGFSVFLYWLDTLDSDRSLLVNMLSQMGWDEGRKEEIMAYFWKTFKWQIPTSLQENWEVLCNEVCPGKANYEACLAQKKKKLKK